MALCGVWPECWPLLHIYIWTFSSLLWTFSPSFHAEKILPYGWQKSQPLQWVRWLQFAKCITASSLSEAVWTKQSAPSYKNPTTFLFQATHILIHLLCLQVLSMFSGWLAGWLFLSLKGRKLTDRTVKQIKKNPRHLKTCSSKQLKMSRLAITLLRNQNITLALTLPPFLHSWLKTCC